MKYNSPIEAHEETGSTKAYYEQYLGAVPVVGKVYTQAKGTWFESDFEIIFISDGVALGTCVRSKVGRKGEKELFDATGAKSGWKYKDIRSVYRLQEKGE